MPIEGFPDPLREPGKAMNPSAPQEGRQNFDVASRHVVRPGRIHQNQSRAGRGAGRESRKHQPSLVDSTQPIRTNHQGDCLEGNDHFPRPETLPQWAQQPACSFDDQPFGYRPDGTEESQDILQSDPKSGRLRGQRRSDRLTKMPGVDLIERKERTLSSKQLLGIRSPPGTEWLYDSERFGPGSQEPGNQDREDSLAYASVSTRDEPSLGCSHVEGSGVNWIAPVVHAQTD